MGCKSLFVNLGGGGSSPDGMLQTPAALSGTLQVVKDNLGNTSALQISTLAALISTSNLAASGSSLGLVNTTGNSGIGFFNGNTNATPVYSLRLFGASASDTRIQMYSAEIIFRTNGIDVAQISNGGNYFTNGGAVTTNGATTFKGGGSNIISLRNSSNVEVSNIASDGSIISLSAYNGFVANRYQLSSGLTTNRTLFSAIGDGIFRMTDAGETDFTRMIFGSNNTSGASIVKNGTALQIKDGSAANFTTIEPLEILTQAPSGGTARKAKFGDKIAVTDGTLTALGIDTQWNVEINGTNYYFLGSTSQFS